jgi:hypothetical protein
MPPNAPLIKLDEQGKAPILRYDIAEPTSYEGKSAIALTFDGDIFSPEASKMPASNAFRELQQLPKDVLRAELATYVRTGFSDRPAIHAIPVAMARRAAASALDAGVTGIAPRMPDSNEPLPPGPADPPGDDAVIDGLLGDVLRGSRLVKGTLIDGSGTVGPQPVPTEPDPHLYLVESIRLTSFLGDYGAGRIVKTFSLLPGEKTKISVKTFLQSETTRKASSSILDSLTQESASDLQTSVDSEQSSVDKAESMKSYYVDADASAKWGWGSADVKAGTKGSTNAAREETVKNVSNAAEKHSQRASAKRDVEVNTSYEESVKAGEETSIERTIENINLSRTLNFVFRQMNQQFTTILHLTDVRIGFFNGDSSSRREVPLSRLDELLEVVVVAGKQAEVRAAILDALSAVRAHDGTTHNVVQTVDIDGQPFIQFDPTVEMSIPEDSGVIRTVAGVLLHHDSLVMRTEGVIVEALLGNGEALDDYAKQMQTIEADRRRAEVDKLQAEAAQLRLVNQAIESGDAAAVDRAERLTRPCCQDQTTAAATGPSVSHG